MAKKDLSGVDVVIGQNPTKAGRPQIHTHKPKTKASIGLPEGYTRATFVIQEVELDRVRALSHWSRVTLSGIVQKAITKFLADYEKKNGPIKALPEKMEL